uniref:Secreted protein n=1 Tax=Oryza sativa subsp. japonica TaxID=39947 RepID=Q6ZBR8_ORYSJ|nr:hypothetical protein [Oryza sativa Japonica Group]BAD09648.1 hypothetical protein [Oryza sativa Japonica Group]
MIFWCVAALHVFLISRNVHFLRHRQPRRRLRPHRSIDFSRIYWYKRIRRHQHILLMFEPSIDLNKAYSRNYVISENN